MVLQGLEALGYERKSPDEKDSRELSLANQEEYIKKTCEEKGWELKEIYIDSNVTGSDRERKGFQRMLKYVYKRYKENPEANIVIVVKDQDRFARDSAFFRDTLKDLEARRIKVYSVLKGGFLSWEDMGDNVMAVVNEQLVITGKKKAEMTIEMKISKGLPCIPAPFGYKYKNKNFSIVKKEAEIVKGIFERNLNYKEAMKEYKIKSGIYYRIMKNIEKGVYSGIISFERKIRDSNKNVIRSEKIEYEGTYEPIISEEAWRKVNAEVPSM